MSRSLAILGVVYLLGGGLPAQDPVIRQAGIHGTTLLPETVRTVLSLHKGLAVTADGAHWALTYFHDGASTSASPVLAQDASRTLLLHVSRDGGRSWSLASRTRTSGSTYGSLAVDPDGTTLHLAWYAWNGRVDAANALVCSIFYSTYDTRTGTWAGTKDEEIVSGTDSSSGTYSVPDIAVTPKGVVGICFGCARGVPAGWVGAAGAWLSGFLWKAKGGSWSAPHQLSLDNSGVYANIQAFGEEFHLCYRVTTGNYGVAYRRFDAAARQFGPEGEVPITPDPANPARNIATFQANNNSHVGLFPGGDVCVLYGHGTAPYVGGKFMYAVAPAGTHTFGQPMPVDDDANMGRGNAAYFNFVLTRLPGGMLAAVYSKVQENHQNLYLRTLTPSGPLPPYGQPAIPLRQGTAPDQFLQTVGQRDLAQITSGYIAHTDLRPAGPLTGGRAVFVGGPAGHSVWKGPGCAGALARSPRLFSLGTPGLGGALSLSLADHPASAPGVLFLGFDDRLLAGLVPLPFPLAGLGMTGCALAQDLRHGIAYLADGAGAAAQGLAVPNDPNLAGLAVFWQSFVFAAQANPGGMVLTNGLATILR